MTQESVPGAGAGLGVAISGAVAGVGGLAVQLVTANMLSPADNARFLVFWALLFGFFGLLAGVQNETTRSVSTAVRTHGASTYPAHPRVLLVGVGVGVALALVVVALSPWIAPAVLGGGRESISSVVAIAAVALGTVAFAGEVSVLGALAGTGRWVWYSALVGGEALLRLVFTVAVAWAGASLLGFQVAAAAAAATWIVLLAVSPTTRIALRVRADRPLGPYLRSTVAAIGAAVGTAVLVTGYAVMIEVTTPAEVVEASAPFLLAVSLTRATLLMPMYAFQGLVIARVVALPHRARALLGAVAVAVVALGLVGAALAWLIGPWLLDTLRPGYHIEGRVLAGLMLGAICLALLVVAGAVCLALSRHRDYVVGWLIAVVVALAALFIPVDLEARTITSLVVGPLLGAAWHVRTLLRATALPDPARVLPT